MKERGTTHWESPNEGATNSGGFPALPGGYRNGDGIFSGIGYEAVYWSATESGGYYAWYRYLNFYSSVVYRLNDFMHYGFRVRLLRD